MLESKRKLLSICLLAAASFQMQAGAFAADANHGKAIAERWCRSCHVVGPQQKTAPTDQAPPFVSIAQSPDFDAARLALLLLAPHPNMPNLSLSRSEVADLAEYIRTLK
jgi:mono/diheme cytochrome c family protein